jgi:hypothetical protein
MEQTEPLRCVAQISQAQIDEPDISINSELNDLLTNLPDSEREELLDETESLSNLQKTLLIELLKVEFPN